MRRSSSDPALRRPFPHLSRAHHRALMPSVLASLRRRVPRSARPSPISTSSPTPTPTAPPSSFADYVRAEMKSPPLHSTPHLPHDHLVATDGPLLLPFARRNLHLRFLQIDAAAVCTARVSTRHEILLDVRQNWHDGADHARNRFPRRPSPSYPHNHAHPTRNSGASPPVRPARARNPSRPTTRHRATASWALPSGSPLTEIRTGGNRLTARDMRQIDPSFTAKPAIWVREDAILVSLESVRAIILHNKLFVFDPDNDKVQAPIWYIRKRLRNDREDIFMPFEFVALEGILIHTCLVLEREFHAIEPQLLRILRDLPQSINNEQLERLRQQEQRLNQYYSRARKVQTALQAVLDEDEDMADMYLTEKRRNPGITRNPVDHDEVEMLLETYMQSVDDLTSRAGLLNRAIDDAENLIEIHLDTMQNRLLLVDLIITAITTILGFGTMITSMFGMNFPLPSVMQELPSSQFYFVGCVVVMFLVMGVGIVVLTRWCNRQGIYRARAHHGRKKRSSPDLVTQASEETRQQVEELLTKPHRPVSRSFGGGVNTGDWPDLAR